MLTHIKRFKMRRQSEEKAVGIQRRLFSRRCSEADNKGSRGAAATAKGGPATVALICD